MPKEKLNDANINIPNGIDWKIKSVFPFLTALKVIFSKDPRAILKSANEGIWFGPAIFIAVTLSVLASLGLIHTPFSPPFDFLISYLRIFVRPEYNIPVLAVIAIFPVAMAFIAYLICFAVGRAASKKLKLDVRQEGQQIAMYVTAICLIVAALANVLAALLLMGSAWGIQKIFKYAISIPLINMWVMCVLAVGLMIFAHRLFKRVGVKFSHWINAATCTFYIATLVVFPSAISSTMIEDHMGRALLERGKAMNDARSLPIQSTLLYCENQQGFSSCSIALYPQEWQNIELVGPWSLGDIKQGGEFSPPMYWRPRTAKNNTISKVMLEPKKYITVEISVPRNSLCKKEGASLGTGDLMFFVHGRVIDEVHNAVRNFKVRVINNTSDLSQIILTICKV